MLNSLELCNIKAHLNTTLNFSPGLNVITGSTDSGKSSIFKALTWTLKNSPRGYNPAPWPWLSASKDVPTSTLKFSDGTLLQRKRGSGINSLRLNSEEFTALRSNIPPQVEKFVAMDEANFQPQEEAFFLVADTGGDAARKINKIANLTGMEEAIQLAKSRVKEAKQQEIRHEENVKHIETKLDELAWVVIAQKKRTILSNIANKLNNRGDEVQALSRALIAVTELQGRLAQFPGDTIVAKTKQLTEASARVMARARAINQITTLINDWSAINTQLNKHNSVLAALSEDVGGLAQDYTNFIQQKANYTEVATCVATYINITKVCDKLLVTTDMFDELWRKYAAVQGDANKLEQIQHIYDAILLQNSEIDHKTKEIGQILTEYNAFKQQYPVCPICGGNLTDV